MSYLPQIAATIIGLLLAMILGATPLGTAGFVLLAVIAGFLATVLAPGSERVYWAAVGAVLLMIVLSYFGLNISGFLFAAPIVFALSNFAARLARKLSGQSA